MRLGRCPEGGRGTDDERQAGTRRRKTQLRRPSCLGRPSHHPGASLSSAASATGIMAVGVAHPREHTAPAVSPFVRMRVRSACIEVEQPVLATYLYVCTVACTPACSGCSEQPSPAYPLAGGQSTSLGRRRRRGAFAPRQFILAGPLGGRAANIALGYVGTTQLLHIQACLGNE